jgi:NADPH:quinone reductase-like Zn-dependent oxidoreductase
MGLARSVTAATSLSVVYWAETRRRGFRKIVSSIDFERARESMREITHSIDGGLVRVPAIDKLPLEDAACAHQLIDTGLVRGKLVLKVADA